jgi:hypothetical protein
MAAAGFILPEEVVADYVPVRRGAILENRSTIVT